jgi:hypothetical protein
VGEELEGGEGLGGGGVGDLGVAGGLEGGEDVGDVGGVGDAVEDEVGGVEFGAEFGAFGVSRVPDIRRDSAEGTITD